MPVDPSKLGRFGRYELIERIGVGGMAEVYRAVDRSPGASNGSVVVKTMLPHLAADAEIQRMFMAEAQLGTQFRHPNVVRVLDLGRVEGVFFLAMEHVDGCDLSRLTRRLEQQKRLLPVYDAVRIVICVLRGLHYAHTLAGTDGAPLALVHRDVTPGNILIARNGDVKLTDFGIAKAERNADEKTQAGTMKGKLRYMPPEQILGREDLDGRADVYAAGLVLHLLLSGTHPFEGLGEMEIIDAVRAGGILPPSTFNVSVPVALDKIVDKATQAEPDARYASAAAFADALELYAAGRMSLRTSTLAQEIDAIAPASPGPPSASEPGSVSKSKSLTLKELAPELGDIAKGIADNLPPIPRK